MNDNQDSRTERKYFKNAFEKKLIALTKRRNQLYIEIRNLPMIALKEPYQRGFKRFFVLRDDIAQGIQASFFQEILDKINTFQIHPDDKFQTKRRRKRKRVYIDKQQALKNFSEYDWSRNPKIILTDKERGFFELRDVYNLSTKRTQKEYVFSQPWRFTLKIEPNMITHVRQLDTDLEQELQYINNYIEKRNLHGKIDKLVYGRKKTYKAYNNSWDLSPRVKREHFKNKTKELPD